jgi:hypothetical protein
VFAVQTRAQLTTVEVVSVADGKVLLKRALAPDLANVVAPSPSGLWFFALQGDPEQSQRLVWTRVDPLVPPSDSDLHELVVPRGADGLLVYPDGEHVIVRDGTTDTLVLVE